MTNEYMREEIRFDPLVRSLAGYRINSYVPDPLGNGEQWQRMAMVKGRCGHCGKDLDGQRRFIHYADIEPQKTFVEGTGQETLPTVRTPPRCSECIKGQRTESPILEVAPPVLVLEMDEGDAPPSPALRSETVERARAKGSIVRFVRGYLQDTWEVDSVTLERTGR
jgi:hypothetical protein